MSQVIVVGQRLPSSREVHPNCPKSKGALSNKLTDKEVRHLLTSLERTVNELEVRIATLLRK